MKKLPSCARNPSTKAKAAVPNSDEDDLAPKRGRKATAKCSQKAPVLEESSDDGAAEKKGSDVDGEDDRVEVK
jgi:hypothetical protein